VTTVGGGNTINLWKKKKVSMNSVVINLHTLLQLNKFSPKTQNISTWGAKKKIKQSHNNGRRHAER